MVVLVQGHPVLNGRDIAAAEIACHGKFGRPPPVAARRALRSLCIGRARAQIPAADGPVRRLAAVLESHRGPSRLFRSRGQPFSWRRRATRSTGDLRLRLLSHDPGTTHRVPRRCPGRTFDDDHFRARRHARAVPPGSRRSRDAARRIVANCADASAQHSRMRSRQKRQVGSWDVSCPAAPTVQPWRARSSSLPAVHRRFRLALTRPGTTKWRMRALPPAISAPSTMSTMSRPASWWQPFPRSPRTMTSRSATPRLCLRSSARRLARKHGLAKLLAGDGGDELFGGNTRYARQKIFEVWWHVPAALRAGCRPSARKPSDAKATAGEEGGQLRRPGERPHAGTHGNLQLTEALRIRK